MSPIAVPRAPSATIGAIALGAAVISGALIAVTPAFGIGFAFALVFAAIVLLDLPLGMAVWAPLLYLSGLPLLSIGPTAGAIGVAVAWLGTLFRGDGAGAHALRDQRGLVIAVLALVVWLALSTAWARDGDVAGDQLWRWGVGAATLIVGLSALASGRAIRLVGAGVVVGGVVTVIVGLAFSGLDPATGATAASTQDEGRLAVVGSNDPNYLAVLLIPTIALAVGLVACVRGSLGRLAVLAAIPVLVYGLAATQSRGGLLGGIIAMLVGVALARRRRLALAGGLVALVTVAILALTTTPGALERVTSTNGGGNGRADLWSIAWRMGADHSVVGVGLGNFVVRSQDYVRDVGRIEFAEFVVDKDPKVAHNLYLQLWAETGMVGVALLIIVLLACLRALLVAAWRFERRGDAGLAVLSRALCAGLAGALAAEAFLTNGTDQRLWLLLAFGPALLALANRPGAGRPVPVVASPSA